MANSPDLSRDLQAALAALRAGRDDEAAQLLSAILARAPDEPDALQLSGMLRRKAGDQEAAIAFYQRSLAARPAQPHVEHSLGNALLATGRRAEADRAYARALALDPRHIDAMIALGESAFEGGDVAEGCAILTRATGMAPNHGRAWSSLGRALRAAGRHDEAIAALQRAVGLRPNHAGSLYNLAVALRLGGRPQDAARILREVLAAQPDLFEAHYVLGHCRQDMRQFDAAAESYRRALALSPGSREAHDALSRMLWQQQGDEAFLASYREALASRPDDAPLIADLAEKLGLAGRVDEALAVLREAEARGVSAPELDYRAGQLLASKKGAALHDAVDPLMRAVKASATDHASRYELIRVLLALGRRADAEAQLAPLLQEFPDDQQAIAFRALLWRLQEDARARQLENVDAFVRAQVLPPPPGYADITAFNRDLVALLDGMHANRHHPLDQTLRGGTQTIGNLLEMKSPLLESLRTLFEDAIRSFVDSLPSSDFNPYRAFRGSPFHFTGSWSVSLASEGFHLSHIHPAGRMSSCYYVSVPDEIADGTDDAGCLVLGQSPLGLGDADAPLATVRPRSGLLVLFPSYMYHATVPFRSAERRLTVAFDVAPA